MIPAIIIGIILAVSFYFILEPIILRTSVDSTEVRESKGIEVHYREALRELEYDLESGKIDKQEFETLKMELEKQLFGEENEDEEA